MIVSVTTTSRDPRSRRCCCPIRWLPSAALLASRRDPRPGGHGLRGADRRRRGRAWPCRRAAGPGEAEDRSIQIPASNRFRCRCRAPTQASCNASSAGPTARLKLAGPVAPISAERGQTSTTTGMIIGRRRSCCLPTCQGPADELAELMGLDDPVRCGSCECFLDQRAHSLKPASSMPDPLAWISGPATSLPFVESITTTIEMKPSSPRISRSFNELSVTSPTESPSTNT